MNETAFSQERGARPGLSRSGFQPERGPIALDYEEKFAFHGARLLFRCNSKGIAEAIGALYGYFRTNDDCSKAFCLKAIDRGPKCRDQERFLLLEEDELSAAAGSFEDFFPLVEWAVFNAACSQIDSFYQVHAAALSNREKGFLILGGPGSGKTVTALALVLRDYKYISDEVALIETKSLLMHPLPRPFLIKRSAFGQFQSLRRKLRLKTFRLEFSGEELWYINPRAISSDAVGRPCKADFVILLEGAKPGRAGLEKLGKSDAAAEMIRQSFNFPSDFRVGVETVGKIVSGASCFRLAGRDLKRSVELINGLLS